MTGKEYKAKLDGIFATYKDAIKMVEEAKGLLWIARTYLKDGGQVDYYYDFNTGEMVICFKNTEKSIGGPIKFSEVSNIIGDNLGEFDFILSKCVWLGENPFKK